MASTGYLLQAALIGAWWVGLATSDAFFAAFQFEGISPTAFWSFFAPDVVLIAALSVGRAYIHRPLLGHLVLGAFAYAALYCINATVLTGTGFLPTGVMLLGLAYNVFLCFHHRLFRRAASTSMAVNGAKTLVQIACVWTLSLGVIPAVILHAFDALRWPERGLGLYAGAAVLVAFSVMGLWSAFVMVRHGGGTPLPLEQTHTLVVQGPYRVVRNPMAVAGIGQGLGVALMFHSAPIAAYALLGAVLWHVVVRPIEERDMVERFGGPYEAYRRQVSCWVPSGRARVG